jgi:acyl-CoA synthetase (AMP-forming)/AMP-acid ligase II
METKEEDNDVESIVSLFDRICFSYGDQDAIVHSTDDAVCYLELQELSRSLAAQLVYRYRPDYVLIDCMDHVTAEAVAILACLYIHIPFVPVSVLDQHAGGRLNVVVDELRKQSDNPDLCSVVAICCCENDQDPALGVFYAANVHPILFLDPMGNLSERIAVPSRLQVEDLASEDDNMYIMFTSGTSEGKPKAVVGSHESTSRRLQWFRDTFEPSPRIARRTRLTFVDSITELFGALLHPPSVLVAVPPDDLRSQGVGALLEINPTQVTLLPSQLAQLLLLPIESRASLERVIISGEPCSESLWNKFRETMPQCQLINLYGQTESTGDVLCAVLTEMTNEKAVVDGIVAVGKPILPTILVETSAENELIVSGNLANGYLGQPPFTSFRTGDVGFCRDGDWYVQGRCDDVEKINGVLTSPSEVEAAFANMYHVTTVAAAILHGAVYLLSEQPVPSFSREKMKEAGLPWNLIPKQIFCGDIPVSQTGAGKVDRSRLRLLLEDLLKGADTKKDDTMDLQSIIKSVLRLSSLDECKSFVEHGGDSATAVTLLYQLRLARLARADLTAADILSTHSITELKNLLCGSQKTKRPRLIDRQQQVESEYTPLPVRRYSAHHVAAPFKACVDASPAVSADGNHFYIGCQGGLVQKIDFETGKATAYRYFSGWMIQADCLIVSESVIICAHSRNSRGMVVALCLDLQQTIWQHEFDAAIKSTPIQLGQSGLCISLGDRLLLLDLKTGTIKASAQLPDHVVARPAVSASGDVALYATSSSLLKVELVSDGHLRVVQVNPKLYDTIGPVYKDLLSSADSTAIVAGSSGNLYTVDIRRAEVGEVTEVSNSPLSSPTRMDGNRLVVGSYDGMFHCIGEGNDLGWKAYVGGAVYTKPLLLPDRSCVICTTAGDIYHIREDGTVLLRYRIAAEIWSDPVCCSALVAGSYRIAFGARDSRVHIITIPP